MSEPKKVTINDTEYTIGLHLGREGIKTALKVQNVLQSEMLGVQSKIAEKLTADDKKAISEDDKNAESIITEKYQDVMLSGVESMLKNLDPDKLFSMLLDLFKHVYVNDKALNSDAMIDNHFQNRYGNIFPLAKEVIQANGFLELSIQELL